MKQFKPNTPYNVPAFLLIPETKRISGVLKKIYPEPTNDDLFYCSFKTFGGTETTVNGALVIENTATIETFYDPKFTANCAVSVNGVLYDIISTPENINMCNQYIMFKVKAVKGGA